MQPNITQPNLTLPSTLNLIKVRPYVTFLKSSFILLNQNYAINYDNGLLLLST